MEDNVLIRRVAVESVSEKYQVDSGYDVIGKECLKNNIKVKQITMPEIRRIGQQAFFSCTALKNAEFPKVVTVGREAFANCSNLRRISFPKSLRSLDKGAFYKCKRANSVSFSEDSACREIPGPDVCRMQTDEDSGVAGCAGRDRCRSFLQVRRADTGDTAGYPAKDRKTGILSVRTGRTLPPGTSGIYR